MGTVITARVLGRFCCLAIIFLTTGALAQGVSVAPNRILLDGRTRSATVFLSNRGKEAETYRISLAYYKMQENGILVRADSMAAEAEDFAGEVLRYSPRRVVVPAGGSQTVRILVRRPAGLEVEDREFRAHLSVHSVPTVPRLREVEAPLPEDLRGDQFVVRPVASIETLVPIIVRFGKPRVEMAISEARLALAEDGDGPVIRFNLERRGERSVYGDLRVLHYDPAGRETTLHLGRGIAIYTPNPRRTFEIRPNVSELDLQKGRILIDYRETTAGGGDQKVQAEIRPPQLSQK